MNEQKGIFKNLYKNLVTPILKKTPESMQNI